jgi:para-nitrobenzyl esterase
VTEGAPRVIAPAGEIEGLRQGEVAVFRGIPYAEPPVGELRWQAPRRRDRFTGVFSATEWGATPQRVALFDVTTVPEPTVPGDDILNLNVFAPTRDGEPRPALPVLVWIHGGGYTAGSSAGSWYDGRSFARDGVIVVTISYRVAFDGFGWLPGAEPNRGMLDWICALEWVRDNIHAFGGDPDRVTIAGQAAGGGAVLALLACERAQSLFSRAISISGVDICLTPDAGRQITAKFADRLGIAATVDQFGALSDAELQHAARRWRDSATNDSVAMFFAPISGLELLPDGVRAGLARTGLDKPLLLGSTIDEFGASTAPGGESATDVLFRSTCARVTRARQRSGKTWLYSFEWASPVTGGATHCADIPFFFDLLDTPGVQGTLGATPQSLATRMHGEAVCFVNGRVLPWNPASGRKGDEARVYGTVSITASGRYDRVMDARLDPASSK